MKYENVFHAVPPKTEEKKGNGFGRNKKRKARQFLIQVENFQDTLEVMNNLAKLLQVPWMGIAGSCFIDVFVGIPYDPFGTQKVQVYSVYLRNMYVFFSCI